MAIKDQCAQCRNFSGSVCQVTMTAPVYNQSSCDNYKKVGISLDKGGTSSNFTPNQPIPTPHDNFNYGSGNNNYVGNPSNHGQGIAPQMSFLDSLFSFSGRSRRSRYWLTSFFCSGIMIVLVLFGAILTGGDEGGIVFGYVLGIIPCMTILFANATKRLHDLGHSGWLQLLVYIPLINFGLVIYLAFFEGQRFDNKYGPSPY